MGFCEICEKTTLLPTKEEKITGNKLQACDDCVRLLTSISDCGKKGYWQDIETHYFKLKSNAKKQSTAEIIDAFYDSICENRDDEIVLKGNATRRKKCEACGESIHFSATKCRFCDAVQTAPLDHIIITTAPSIEGYEIIETISVETGAYTVSTNITGVLVSGSTSISLTADGALSQAKEQAMARLIARCKGAGANAIIGLDYDISEVTSGSIVVSANGTSVFVKRKDY